jgi:hypothetical protein
MTIASMSERKVAEAEVPPFVVEAFETRYAHSFDLTRDDHEWRNTWRYKHKNIQSLWVGWRDCYLALQLGRDMAEVAWMAVNYAHEAAYRAKDEGRLNSQARHEANEATARAVIANSPKLMMGVCPNCGRTASYSERHFCGDTAP